MTNPILTKEELAAIRARCEAASPGPWKAKEAVGFCGRSTALCLNMSEGSELCDNCVAWRWDSPAWVVGAYNLDLGRGDGLSDENAQFIAHARQDIPALLDALEAAEARVAEAELCEGIICNVTAAPLLERIKALERVMKFECSVCLHKESDERNHDSPCYDSRKHYRDGKCVNCNNWQLDYARFSGEEE